MLKKIVLFASLFSLTRSVKVIIFVPTMANSGIVFNYRVGDLLAQAGHDVTMFRPQLNPDAHKGSSNLTKEIRVRAYKDPEFFREFESHLASHTFKTDKMDWSAGKGPIYCHPCNPENKERSLVFSFFH